jgi:hypothetical protein
MKSIYLTLSLLFVLSLTACMTTSPGPKSVVYDKMYQQKPLTVLLMPPINNSTNVDAKEYFHVTLNKPIIESGYYVIPPFISMDILKNESAYDSELFLDGPLDKFRDIFGADLALFTIVHKWDKSGIRALVTVQVEYILKSTTTNEVVHTRKGEVKYDASVNTGISGIAGIIANVALSAANTALTEYVDVARACNAYTFSDIPAGVYNPNHGKDGSLQAGIKNFKVNLSSKYR